MKTHTHADTHRAARRVMKVSCCQVVVWMRLQAWCCCWTTVTAGPAGLSCSISTRPGVHVHGRMCVYVFVSHRNFWSVNGGTLSTFNVSRVSIFPTCQFMWERSATPPQRNTFRKPCMFNQFFCNSHQTGLQKSEWVKQHLVRWYWTCEWDRSALWLPWSVLVHQQGSWGLLLLLFTAWFYPQLPLQHQLYNHLCYCPPHSDCAAIGVWDAFMIRSGCYSPPFSQDQITLKACCVFPVWAAAAHWQ